MRGGGGVVSISLKNAGLLFSHAKVTEALAKTSGTKKLSNEGKPDSVRQFSEGKFAAPTLNLLLIKTDVGLGAQTQNSWENLYRLTTPK